MIDLNADVGERPDAIDEDRLILGSLTSANVACGFHAGNAQTMLAVCEMAAELGVAVGAHVSYRDREGFGRREVEIGREALAAQVAEQIQVLRAAAILAGTSVRYVKAHGALYNRAAHDYEHAEAIVLGVVADASLPVLCPPGSALEDVARDYEITPVAEGFADRLYMPDRSLAARGVDGAVLDQDAAAEQAILIATGHEFPAAGGQLIRLNVRSLCLHSDTPGAVDLAAVVRETLQASGISVEAFA